jgi:RNA polymerase sigma-B factor
MAATAIAPSRDELIERHLPLARSLAMRFQGPHEALDDLIQVASLGLVKAADRWDEGRGFAFSSFAVPTILGELRRYFRDHTWDVRPRRAVQELTVAVERARDELSTELGRSPTVGDIAERTGATVDDVLEAIDASHQRSSVSLDAPVRRDEGDAATTGDVVGCEDDGFELVELASEVASLTRSLDPRAREILRLRFSEDLLQSEVAERLGCSQMQVSRSIRASLQHLQRLHGV